MAKVPEHESGPINTITQGTTIKGNITASGDFRMDGNLQGDITLNGKLVIGEKGVVSGNITCVNANIIGTVIGNIAVKELLSLHSTAKVKGDVIINKLSIEPGASFSGTCRMSDEVERSRQATTQPQSATQPQPQPQNGTTVQKH